MPEPEAAAATQQAAPDPSLAGIPEAMRAALAALPDTPPAAEETATTDATEPGESKPEAAPQDEAQPKAEDEAKPAAPETKADLKGLSAEELLSNPDVAGKVGRLAQQQAREEVQRFFAERDANAWRQRLGEAIEADPDHPLAQLLKQAQPQAQQQPAEQLGQAQTVLMQTVAAFVKDELPQPVRQKYQDTVAGKDVTFQGLVKTVAELLVEHELPKRVEAELEAKWKDYQAERLGGEASPVVNQASKSGAGRQITQREIDAMDWREYAKVEPDIMAGRIKLVAA